MRVKRSPSATQPKLLALRCKMLPTFVAIILSCWSAEVSIRTVLNVCLTRRVGTFTSIAQSTDAAEKRREKKAKVSSEDPRMQMTHEVSRPSPQSARDGFSSALWKLLANV